eukprot:TRINITY_DN368_c0_g1_i1.p1 TRINITY_DN368_c0_g1~~TRINITY_DN368_c0_g1_i1.p1  ORF type:complete len:189 (+),score=43.43 TRINITY_DN368_c0_g1_i1:57-569(+)
MATFLSLFTRPRFFGTSAAPTNLVRQKILQEFVGTVEQKTGRSWRASELRLKSFDDLHKLWYVCLKERNRLETIRHACRSRGITMPDHGRLGKVKVTMARLKTVVGERTRAYNAEKEQELKLKKAAEQEAKRKELEELKLKKFEEDKAAYIAKRKAEMARKSQKYQRASQ